MGRHTWKTWLAIASLLATSGGLAWATEKAPAVAEAELTPVWGTVYRLKALVTSGRGPVTAAEYRSGRESGALFAADGLLDSREEWVETYVTAGAPGERIQVRARAGGVWSEWHDIEGADGGTESAAGCTLSAGARGAGEWFRSAVTVDCSGLLASEGAESIEYSLGFYEWSPAGEAFVIEDEGVHWVQVRSIGPDGSAGLPSTFTVAIDRTPPGLWMQVPWSQVLTHADQLLLDFEAEDALSGIDLVTADLNGEQEIMAGIPVELWQLPLGRHTLSVHAKDRAGNVSAWREPVELEITVNAGALANMVKLFSARGQLDGYTGLRDRLLGTLEQVQAEQSEGNIAAARGHLARFAEEVQSGLDTGLIFSEVAEVLTDDATWLMDSLGDDLPGEAPPWTAQ